MGKDAKQLLGEMVDLSVKDRQSFERGGRIRTDYVCLFCGDSGNTPLEVRHKHKCIVAQAKDFLQGG